MAVQQAVKDARSRRLADGRRNSGDCKVGLMLHIHTLILNELLSERHTVRKPFPSLGAALSLDVAIYSGQNRIRGGRIMLSAKRGVICEKIWMTFVVLVVAVGFGACGPTSAGRRTWAQYVEYTMEL